MQSTTQWLFWGNCKYLILWWKERRGGGKEGGKEKVNSCLRKIPLGIDLVRVQRESESIGGIYMSMCLFMYVCIYVFTYSLIYYKEQCPRLWWLVRLRICRMIYWMDDLLVGWSTGWMIYWLEVWRSMGAHGVALVLVQRPKKPETHGVVPVWRPASLRPKRPDVPVQVRKEGNVDVPVQRQQEGAILFYSGQSQPFCSIQMFNWLNKAHSCLEEESALLSWPI